MKIYSIFHPLWMSFYSKSLYRDVAKNWRGIAAGYLLLLLAIVWLPGLVQFAAMLRVFVTENAPQWVAQVPNITIKEGVVSIDKPQPYFIKNPQNGTVAVIFDNTGQYTNLDNTTAQMLITKTEIITRKNQQETRVHTLTKNDNYVLTQAKVDQFVHSTLWWMPTIMYVVMVLGSFIYRLIQALLYALVGLIYSRFIKYEIHYQPTYRLTIIALTPVIIISSILSYLHILFPFQLLFYLVLGLGYVIFGVRVNKESELTPQIS